VYRTNKKISTQKGILPTGEDKSGPDGLLRGPFMLGKALSLVEVGYWWWVVGGCSEKWTGGKRKLVTAEKMNGTMTPQSRSNFH
jgi:hypothetical protein